MPHWSLNRETKHGLQADKTALCVLMYFSSAANVQSTNVHYCSYFQTYQTIFYKINTQLIHYFLGYMCIFRDGIDKTWIQSENQINACLGSVHLHVAHEKQRAELGERFNGHSTCEKIFMVANNFSTIPTNVIFNTYHRTFRLPKIIQERCCVMMDASV